MVNISVVIPVYNVKKYLKACMDSLAAQTLSNCEFICIDDGSTDDSYRIIENYINKDKRFKLIRQENKGLAETRNVGIRRTQGKYIVFLDADDYFVDGDVLDKLYQRAERDNLEVISFETDLFYEGSLRETDNKDFYYDKKHVYNGIRKGRDFFVEMMSMHEYCDSACFLCVKRAWLFERGIWFYPGILYEDALFCMQCFLQAERMIHLSAKLYTYRIREKSIMTSEAKWENVRSRIILYREILRLFIRFGENDLELQKAMAEYLALIAFHAKYLDEFRIDRQPDMISNPLDELLIKTMGLGDYRIEVNEDVILNGLEKLVADSEGIILYGAGNVGRLFYRFLKDKGLDEKVLCFAVSENKDEKEKVNGISVLSISEAIRKEGQIFLSVVEQKAQRAMRETLRQFGVRQFQVFDQYIYRALRHYGRTLADM